MRTIVTIFIVVSTLFCRAQKLYELTDNRPDPLAGVNKVYDSLEIMCDSFYYQLQFETLSSLSKFVPQVRFLKSTFDTMAIEYRNEQVVYRQQMMLRNLQRDYKKILKYAEKHKLKLKRLVRKNREYIYGKDKDANEYCYVTEICQKKKRTYVIKYLAIKLNGKWFVGDEFYIERAE